MRKHTHTCPAALERPVGIWLWLVVITRRASGVPGRVATEPMEQGAA
jgi:hypothetical protein